MVGLLAYGAWFCGQGLDSLVNGQVLTVSALVGSFQAVPIATHVSTDGAHGKAWFRLAAAGEQLFTSALQIAFRPSARQCWPISRPERSPVPAPQLTLFAVGFPITVILGPLVLLFGMRYLVPMLEANLVKGLKLFTS